MMEVNQTVCKEHFGVMPFMKFAMRGFGCHPFEVSKETRIKSLEAMKSRLEDFIKEIDQQIEEVQKEKA
jgi:hypothetical protein